jgi:hypothetical protein
MGMQEEELRMQKLKCKMKKAEGRKPGSAPYPALTSKRYCFEKGLAGYSACRI